MLQKFKPVLWGGLVIGLLVIIASLVPQNYQPPAAIFALGMIGVWRYIWNGIHILRALVYEYIAFPIIDSKAAKLTIPTTPINCLVMSYQTEPRIFERVFTQLFDTAQQSRHPVTIVAALTNTAEAETLQALFHHYKNEHLKLTIQIQTGEGKRAALSNAISSLETTDNDQSLTVFMDGDTLVPDSCFDRIVPYFYNDPKLGALTLNNEALVVGSDPLRYWYKLKHLQRHWLMRSMALSRRLLVLTGRFSVFRTELVCQQSFINQIKSDSLNHWLFDTITFKTGEDKSSWFWLLKRNWNMLYLPNLMATSIEDVRGESFSGFTFPIMKRWYGNMYRAGRKAVRLGPTNMPIFTWWSLVDQFISPWTTLSAPVGIIILLLINPGNWPTLALFALWVMFTRTIYSGFLCGKDWHPLFPFILYYNQVIGACIKVYALFHPQQQGWTGQFLAQFKEDLGQTVKHDIIASTNQVACSFSFVYAIHLIITTYGV